MVTIRREEAESSLHKGGERTVPGQGHYCGTWAQGSQLPPAVGDRPTPEGPRELKHQRAGPPEPGSGQLSREGRTGVPAHSRLPHYSDTRLRPEIWGSAASPARGAHCDPEARSVSSGGQWWETGCLVQVQAG